MLELWELVSPLSWYCFCLRYQKPSKSPRAHGTPNTCDKLAGTSQAPHSLVSFGCSLLNPLCTSDASGSKFTWIQLQFPQPVEMEKSLRKCKFEVFSTGPTNLDLHSQVMWLWWVSAVYSRFLPHSLGDKTHDHKGL